MTIKSFHIKLISISLIVFLGIIVYSHTLHCAFQYDDNVFLVSNPAIKHVGEIAGIWNYYPTRFFTDLSFAINYHFFHFDVPGYHLTNITIHLISAILIWWLVLLTLSTPAMKEEKISQHAHLIALGAGLVFVSHPVQTEAVTYVWQRAASMATMFYLASLCFYVKAKMIISCHCEERSDEAISDGSYLVEIASRPLVARNDIKSVFFYFCSIIAAVLAMFTKETAITLPLMVLLYEFTFLRTHNKMDWKFLAPFLCAIFVIPLTGLVTGSINFREMQLLPSIEGHVDITPVQYFLTELRVMITYVRLAFLPLNQHLDYDYHISRSFFELPTLLSFLFLGIILFATLRIYPKYRLVSFSIFWFFLSLLPESSFLHLEDVIYEHRLYLPLVGYSIFFPSALFYFLGKDSVKTMAAALIMAVAFYSALTYQRNKVWQNEFTLWNDAVRKASHKARPYNNRSVADYDAGHYDQAIIDGSMAIKLNPSYAEAYNNRGLAFDAKGYYAQAISDFSMAITVSPEYAQAYFNRGLTYYHTGNNSQAIADYTRATQLNPRYAIAYNNRGAVYFAQGNNPQAIADYNKAIELNPELEVAYGNRKQAYEHMTAAPAVKSKPDYTKVVADYTKAINENPRDASAYNNRGLAYYAQGMYDHVISDCSKAIKLNPDYAIAYSNRALAYEAKGKLSQAVSDYARAIKINPNLAAAYYNRSFLYLKLKEYDKARADMQKAQELGVSVRQ